MHGLFPSRTPTMKLSPPSSFSALSSSLQTRHKRLLLLFFVSLLSLLERVLWYHKKEEICEMQLFFSWNEKRPFFFFFLRHLKNFPLWDTNKMVGSITAAFVLFSLSFSFPLCFATMCQTRFYSCSCFCVLFSRVEWDRQMRRNFPSELIWCWCV